jgi:hypothetical protein
MPRSLATRDGCLYERAGFPAAKRKPKFLLSKLLLANGLLFG